jgi:hypothetical protein
MDEEQIREAAIARNNSLMATQEHTWHIDVGDGSARRCRRPNDCGWGEPEEHHATARAATREYEALSLPFLMVRSRKVERREFPDARAARSAYHSLRERNLPIYTDWKHPNVLWEHRMELITRLR